MSKEMPLSPQQKKWIDEEIVTRKNFKPTAFNDDSIMLLETHKEVIRALQQLDGLTAGKTKDDFDVLVNVIHRSMLKSLLKVNQEKWRTAELKEANRVIDLLEQKYNRNAKEELTIKINKKLIDLLQALKLGSKKLGKNKADFDEVIQELKRQAVNPD